jgi:hypothetical protein
VRSLAALGMSVAARRSPGSGVLDQSSCQVLAFETWMAWRQFPGGWDLIGMDRLSRREALGAAVRAPLRRTRAARPDRAQELPWRDRADVRASSFEQPAWLREFGLPPTTVKGQRPIGRPSSGSSSTGNAAPSPIPTARSARTGRPGPGAAPPPPDQPSAARPAPATKVRLRGGAPRRRPAQDGPRVPAKAGRSALGRRWSRAEKSSTREFERLREARSQR